MIVRTYCVICRSDLNQHIGTFHNIPIWIGATDLPVAADVFENQKWAICNECGCVQLQNLVDPELLYQKSHLPGLVGETWSRHHQEFSEFSKKYLGASVVEIGAGSDTLAKKILATNTVKSYTIIDPLVESSDIVGLRVVQEFFTSDFSTTPTYDTVLHSHTMEHFYNVREELYHLTKILKTNGSMVVSVPLTSISFGYGWHNSLNFQHTYMTTIENLRYLFELAALQIEELIYFNDVNVFIAATKKPYIKPTLTNEYENNLKLFESYVHKTKTRIDSIIQQLNTKPHKPTFIFGAHVFSQMPLSMYPELIPHIVGVLDNNVSKQGKRLHGFAGLTIFSPHLLKYIDNPRVIVDGAQYTDEIIKSLREVNRSVEIL